MIPDPRGVRCNIHAYCQLFHSPSNSCHRKPAEQRTNRRIVIDTGAHCLASRATKDPVSITLINLSLVEIGFIIPPYRWILAAVRLLVIYSSNRNRGIWRRIVAVLPCTIMIAVFRRLGPAGSNDEDIVTIFNPQIVWQIRDTLYLLEFWLWFQFFGLWFWLQFFGLWFCFDGR